MKVVISSGVAPPDPALELVLRSRRRPPRHAPRFSALSVYFPWQTWFVPSRRC